MAMGWGYLGFSIDGNRGSIVVASPQEGIVLVEGWEQSICPSRAWPAVRAFHPSFFSVPTLRVLLDEDPHSRHQQESDGEDSGDNHSTGFPLTRGCFCGRHRKGGTSLRPWDFLWVPWHPPLLLPTPSTKPSSSPQATVSVWFRPECCTWQVYQSSFLAGTRTAAHVW